MIAIKCNISVFRNMTMGMGHKRISGASWEHNSRCCTGGSTTGADRMHRFSAQKALRFTTYSLLAGSAFIPANPSAVVRCLLSGVRPEGGTILDVKVFILASI